MTVEEAGKSRFCLSGTSLKLAVVRIFILDLVFVYRCSESNQTIEAALKAATTETKPDCNTQKVQVAARISFAVDQRIPIVIFLAFKVDNQINCHCKVKYRKYERKVPEPLQPAVRTTAILPVENGQY